jgi:pimeloyl-ACP methyl ester carboxylesterase
MDKTMVHLNGDIDYAVTDVGEGPPVLLLHGFPDTAALWRHQIPCLVDAGYRVIAPDLRGFGDSSRPDGVHNYEMLKLVGDISSLLRRLGVARAHVVGHDWGAALAWVVAAGMPSTVDHLVCLSVGHPLAYSAPSLDQRAASWYILLFQFEGVAETLLTRDNWRLFREMMRAHGLDDQTIGAQVADLRRPGALTAALNWYRANRHPRAEIEAVARLPFVRSPTLSIWGSGDVAMLEDAVLASSAFVQGPWRYESIPGGGHWIPLSRPDRVNQLLLEFLGSQETEPAVRRVRRSY